MILLQFALSNIIVVWSIPGIKDRAKALITDNMPFTAEEIAHMERFVGNEVFIDATKYNGQPRYSCGVVTLDLQIRAQVWINSYVEQLYSSLELTDVDVVCYRDGYILDSNHILADYNFRTCRVPLIIKLVRRKALVGV